MGGSEKRDFIRLEIILSYLFALNCLFLCLSALPETILETAGHGLQVTHTTCAFSSASLGFLSPVELSHFLTGVSARRAGSLLNVVTDLAASAAGSVRLVVSLSE